jgi:hypothetical protein
MVFANNHLLSGYQGIKIDADVSNQTSSIKIVNNHFSSTIVVDIWLDSVLYGFIAGNHCSNSTSSIYEHNTKSNGQNVFVGNYLASTPTKSSASYWFNNFGDMAWTAFTPVFTGFSADPAATGTRYIQIGKTVVVNYACFGGTSNATTLTASLPITPKTNGSSYIRNFWARVQDNGATPADPGLVEFDIDSGSLTVYKDHSGAAFTNSGTKGFRAVITYEIG